MIKEVSRRRPPCRGLKEVKRAMGVYARTRCYTLRLRKQHVQPSEDGDLLGMIIEQNEAMVLEAE